MVRRFAGAGASRQLRRIFEIFGRLTASRRGAMLAPVSTDLRERSSGGQSDRRPAPKEQPPPETLRQKDRVGSKLWKAGRPTPGQVPTEGVEPIPAAFPRGGSR